MKTLAINGEIVSFRPLKVIDVFDLDMSQPGLQFFVMVGARLSGKPYEFFTNLKIVEFAKVCKYINEELLKFADKLQ